MKKTLQTLILLTAVMLVAFAQYGFVAVAYDDNITHSSASVGQMFTQGVSVDDNYANEGARPPMTSERSNLSNTASAKRNVGMSQWMGREL